MIMPTFINVIMETIYYALLSQAKESITDELRNRERQKPSGKSRRKNHGPKQYEW